jgi:outer membrane protein
VEAVQALLEQTDEGMRVLDEGVEMGLGGARDVRAAVLNAQIAFQRIGVTQELLNQANTALELAQARYRVGLSGIVDLTQAQLAQTEALIGVANARYTYQTALAVVRYQTGQ